MAPECEPTRVYILQSQTADHQRCGIFNDYMKGIVLRILRMYLPVSDKTKDSARCCWLAAAPSPPRPLLFSVVNIKQRRQHRLPSDATAAASLRTSQAVQGALSRLARVRHLLEVGAVNALHLCPLAAVRGGFRVGILLASASKRDLGNEAHDCQMFLVRKWMLEVRREDAYLS